MDKCFKCLGKDLILQEIMQVFENVLLRDFDFIHSNSAIAGTDEYTFETGKDLRMNSCDND